MPLNSMRYLVKPSACSKTLAAGFNGALWSVWNGDGVATVGELKRANRIVADTSLIAVGRAGLAGYFLKVPFGTTPTIEVCWTLNSFAPLSVRVAMLVARRPQKVMRFPDTLRMR